MRPFMLFKLYRSMQWAGTSNMVWIRFEGNICWLIYTHWFVYIFFFYLNTVPEKSHFGSSRQWFHLSSRQNMVAPSLSHLLFVCALLAVSVTSSFFFFWRLSVSLSTSLCLIEHLDSRSPDCSVKIQRVPRLLFFIIKYGSNNLAANKINNRQKGGRTHTYPYCAGVATDWPHTVVPKGFKPVKAL